MMSLGEARRVAAQVGLVVTETADGRYRIERGGRVLLETGDLWDVAVYSLGWRGGAAHTLAAVGGVRGALGDG